MIIFPMCGESKRFKIKGYRTPKFLLNLRNRTIFYHVVNGFRKYINKDLFVFIINNPKYKIFLLREFKKLNLKKYRIVTLKSKTNGQAETVFEGIKNIKINNGLYIFNIDTILKKFEKKNTDEDGYWEVFLGKGDNWSFAKIKNNKVIATSEKKRISNLCSNGLYFFKKKKLFLDSYKNSIEIFKKNKNELYVSLLYNYLIEKKKIIKIKKINIKNIIFCGTPSEYETAKKLPNFL